MTDKFSWTASCGRWWGIPLKVHLFFLLFASVVFCVEWHYLQMPGTLAGTALVTVIVVFGSALFHEMAHAFAASTLGGQLQSVILKPWGGDSDILMPPSPREQFVVHAAGPFFNFFIFLVGALLLAMTGQSTLWALVDPFHPIPVQWGTLEISLIKIASWVNFQMFLVNMIPCFSFDASRLIRSAVMAYNPRTPSLNLENAILGMGIASGLVMFVLAWLSTGYNHGPLQPTWFILVVTGILLIFNARYGYHVEVVEARRELQMLDQYMHYDMLEDDFEAGDSYLTEFEEDAIADWLHDQQPGTEFAERSVAIDEEQRVDLILKKLHQDGIESLSEDERAFLNRISQQYRRRRELKS